MIEGKSRYIAPLVKKKERERQTENVRLEFLGVAE